MGGVTGKARLIEEGGVTGKARLIEEGGVEALGHGHAVLLGQAHVPQDHLVLPGREREGGEVSQAGACPPRYRQVHVPQDHLVLPGGGG